MMRAEIIGAVVIAATIGFTLTISPAAFADAGGVPAVGNHGNHYGQLPPYGSGGGPVPPGMKNPVFNGQWSPAPGWSQGNKTGWSGVPGVRTR